jgi:hypothetical protein
MFSTGCLRVAFFALLMLAASAAARAQTAPTDAVLFRIFLRDGSTLISYGEYARVGDRVVLTLPIGGDAAAPQLHVLSIPSDRVDWEKTDAYAESVRATRYAATQGPDDFALLSEGVSRALTDIALTTDRDRKASMAIEARQNVMKWVAEHYGYRAQDAARMASMFDDIVAESRAASGVPNFDLTLIANTAAPPSIPLLPVPTVQESAEQALRAVALSPDASERISLLQAIQATIGGLPTTDAPWSTTVRSRLSATLAMEERTTKSYDTLTRDLLKASDQYAGAGDVTGVERVIRRALTEDDRLGQRRPQEMAALLATLDGKLDAARRLRLARDSWAARTAALRAYQTALLQPLAAMRAMRPSLDEIRRLAGPSPTRLTRLLTSAAAALKAIEAVPVPVEAETAHGLLKNAAQLASRAAEGRRSAILSGEMQRAWDASAAASGSLLLFERAEAELQNLTKGPVLKPAT